MPKNIKSITSRGDLHCVTESGGARWIIRHGRF